MATILTSDVFTPAKLPTFTDVDRTSVSKELALWVNRGGFFVSLLGTTKLGKTTLVKSFLKALPSTAWSTYIPGQSLGSGADELWLKLAQALQIPTSKESGLASSNKASWGAMARLQATFFPGAGASVQSQIAQEQQKGTSSGEKFEIDPEQAVIETLTLMREQKMRVVVAIDDFHFVTDADARRSIVLALRPLADLGCSVILSTIPGGEVDPAFERTQTGGRRKTVTVPRWDVTELEKIATQGLHALGLWAPPTAVTRLAEESFGSPQIMQQLCLDLCEIENGIYERDSDEEMLAVNEPDDFDEFFVSLEDDEAMGWLGKLSAGPNPRKRRRKRDYPRATPPPLNLDGYQLIMQAMHELGSPHEVAVADIKRHIGDKLGVEPKELNTIAIELKAQNLGELAAKDTTDALKNVAETETVDPDEDESAAEESMFAELVTGEAIPQPVFEVRGTDTATVRVLDPLVSYMIKWHPEIIVSSGRK